MTYSYPSTPVRNRVREGNFGEAILPVGEQPGPVYVYAAATRIWHWVTALCIVVLGEVRWYLFMGKPKEYIGHNPLAHFAMFAMFVLPTIVLLLTGFALYAEDAGVQSLWYRLFGWVFVVIGDSFAVHTWHNVAMWIVIIFSMVHMYMAIREDMTHRQTAVSSMVSGWRFFR